MTYTLLQQVLEVAGPSIFAFMHELASNFEHGWVLAGGQIGDTPLSSMLDAKDTLDILQDAVSNHAHLARLHRVMQKVYALAAEFPRHLGIIRMTRDSFSELIELSRCAECRRSFSPFWNWEPVLPVA